MADTVTDSPALTQPLSSAAAGAITTPLPAASVTQTDPNLGTSKFIRFRRRKTDADLQSYRLQFGEPAISSDGYNVYVGTPLGNLRLLSFADLNGILTADAAMQALMASTQEAMATASDRIAALEALVASLQSQITTNEEESMAFRNSSSRFPEVAISATGAITKPAQSTTYLVDTTAGNVAVTLYSSTGDNTEIEFFNDKGTGNVSFVLTAGDTSSPASLTSTVIGPGEEQGFKELASKLWGAK